MLALARAVSWLDNHTLRLLKRHRDCYDQYVAQSADGCSLANLALFEQQLSVAMLGVVARRTQRAGRESNADSMSENTRAKRTRAGAIRVAQVWQVQRLALRLSGGRVEGGVGWGEDEVVRRGSRGHQGALVARLPGGGGPDEGFARRGGEADSPLGIREARDPERGGGWRGRQDHPQFH